MGGTIRMNGLGLTRWKIPLTMKILAKIQRPAFSIIGQW